MAIDERSLPDQSIDQTLLSDDVYFDLDDAAPTECALGGREVEEEELDPPPRCEEAEVTEPVPLPLPLPMPYAGLPYRPNFHRNASYPAAYDDTVSELSVDQYSKEPRLAVEMEYLDGVDLDGFELKDTPRTIPIEYLEGMEVTAWNKDGLGTTTSKGRTCTTRNLCLLFACLLLIVAAVTVTIGVQQAKTNEPAAGSSDLSAVGGQSTSDAIENSPFPSAPPSESPSEQDDTGSKPAPPAGGTSSAPSSAAQSTSSSPTPEATSTSTADLSPSPTAHPPSVPSASKPTFTPTFAESESPTIGTTTQSPTDPITTESPTIPTESPTDQISTESPTDQIPTESPTDPISTESPTPEETESPSPSPTEGESEVATSTPTEDSSTSSPTPSDTDSECVDNIESDRRCYETGDTARIVFENCDPRSGDWIGIYRNPDNIDPSELEEPRTWTYTCGDRDCLRSAGSGELSLSFGSFLPVGSYGVYLARQADAPPYSSIAMSTFELSDDCT